MYMNIKTCTSCVAADIYPCVTPYHNDVCYWNNEGVYSYTDARAACQADSGTLAMIFNETINTFLRYGPL